jgi:hypothetical protein
VISPARTAGSAASDSEEEIRCQLTTAYVLVVSLSRTVSTGRAVGLMIGERLSAITNKALQQRVVELENALATLMSRSSSQPLLGPSSAAEAHIQAAEGGTMPEVLDRSYGQLVLGETAGSSMFLGEAAPGYIYVSTHVMPR